MTDIGKRLRAEYQLAGRPITKGRLLIEAADEIDRLQEAKRRALAIADERSKENVALRKALTDIIETNKDFRAGMPDDWEGDPLQDACDAAAKLLTAVVGKLAP